MGSLRHGAGVAGNHEIRNAQDVTLTGKWLDETMEEARRVTERVRRARRRVRQRANRRLPGKDCRAKGGEGDREDAGDVREIQRRLSFLEKLVFRQENFLAGGETAARAYAYSPSEIHRAIRACVDMASEQSDVQGKIVQCLAGFQSHVQRIATVGEQQVDERFQAVEQTIAECKEVGVRLAKAEGVQEDLRAEVAELERWVRCERGRQAAWADETEKRVSAMEEAPKQIGADLGTARDDLEGIRGVV